MWILAGQVLECSLAKPQADQKSVSSPSNSHKSALLPSYPPRGYGLVGSPFGALGAGYGATGFAQVSFDYSLLIYVWTMVSHTSSHSFILLISFLLRNFKTLLTHLNFFRVH